MDVKPAVASADDIGSLISRLNRFEDAVQKAVEEGEDDAGPLEIVDLRESAEDAPVIKLVHSIIAQAAERGASDIHFEPQMDDSGRVGGDLRVRMRIDGVLTDETSVPKRMVSGVVSRIKIMSELDISERRIPQDGRCGLTIDGRRVDVRVVTIPSCARARGSCSGSSTRTASSSSSTRSGMQPSELDRFRTAFHRAHGAVLATGPTGSGKSTSLYGALLELNTPEKNIITIEDPVEYEIKGITQVQVNNKAGLTFATGLRSMMRADPDILMVGEIRDRETAQIADRGCAHRSHGALDAAHQRCAVGDHAPDRDGDRAVPGGLRARMHRRAAARAHALPALQEARDRPRRACFEATAIHAHFDIEAYEPGGCARCGSMGYRGRIGLYEVMMMSEEIRALTLQRASADQIAAVAVREGMRRLRDDGLEKVQAGLTSMAEIARVTGSH